MKIHFYAFDSIPSFYPFELVISSLILSSTPIKPKNYFILNKNLSWLCLYLFLSPLPSFLGAFTQYSLISPVPYNFQGTPNAKGSEYFSVFILLFTSPSFLEIIPLASLTSFILSSSPWLFCLLFVDIFTSTPNLRFCQEVSPWVFHDCPSFSLGNFIHLWFWPIPT